MTREAFRLDIRVRIYCGDEIAMGPGKADLLDAIGREGSISGAGRAMGMSYRRTWLLVDAMNRCWKEPLVDAAAGGSRGGGATVTEAGRDVLSLYRAIQAAAARADAGESWQALEKKLREAPLSLSRSAG